MDAVDFSAEICSPLTDSHKNVLVRKNMEHAGLEKPALTAADFFSACSRTAFLGSKWGI